MQIAQIKRLQYLDKGKRSLVFVGMLKNQCVAVKVYKTSDATTRAKKEAYFMKLLNSKNIGPKFLSLQDDFIVYNFIRGERFSNWVNSASKEAIIFVLKKIMLQCFQLDLLKINKLEFHNPKKHILIDKKNSPVFIDFERCYFTKNPKNLTQFCQFLTSPFMQSILIKKNINVDKKVLIKNLKLYKKNISKKTFQKIVSFF